MLQRQSQSLALALLIVAAPDLHAQSSAAPPVPAPGRMVDLGGWRLHLNCSGKPSPAQPTVILEAGAGGLALDWSLVQPGVAHLARVCSYDRAGAGWSDLGPRPRTLRQKVWELHALLERAGERPPYILVGQSYGGILARLYAATYPTEVAGMVFSESGHERGVAVWRDGKMVNLADAATGQTIPAVRTEGPLRESEIPERILEQIRSAAAQLGPKANDPPYDRLPADTQRMRVWALSQTKHYAANDNPLEGEELAALLAARAKEPQPLGGMPLIVVSRGRQDADGPVEDAHTANQASLVGLSRAGKQVIARRSGHAVPLEQPEAIVAAIEEVLTALRR